MVLIDLLDLADHITLSFLELALLLFHLQLFLLNFRLILFLLENSHCSHDFIHIFFQMRLRLGGLRLKLTLSFLFKLILRFIFNYQTGAF